MELDETDRRLIALVLEDADRSLRALAGHVEVSAPTVANRLDRLEELGLLGPVRREADLARLGSLVWILAPADQAQALADHETVFEVHRTAQNRVAALALLEHTGELRGLQAAFPTAETHVLTERLHASTPPFEGHEVQASCDECGKAIEGEPGIELTLGDRRYLACCPTCEARLRERYERHAAES